jgi:CobQ-like glutamine amidotransferase family enzyme
VTAPSSPFIVGVSAKGVLQLKKAGAHISVEKNSLSLIGDLSIKKANTQDAGGVTWGFENHPRKENGVA